MHTTNKIDHEHQKLALQLWPKYGDTHRASEAAAEILTAQRSEETAQWLADRKVDPFEARRALMARSGGLEPSETELRAELRARGVGDRDAARLASKEFIRHFNAAQEFTLPKPTLEVARLKRYLDHRSNAGGPCLLREYTDELVRAGYHGNAAAAGKEASKAFTRLARELALPKREEAWRAQENQRAAIGDRTEALVKSGMLLRDARATLMTELMRHQEEGCAMQLRAQRASVPLGYPMPTEMAEEDPNLVYIWRSYGGGSGIISMRDGGAGSAPSKVEHIAIPATLMHEALESWVEEGAAES